MLSFFKSRKSRDFDKAMDFLDCSRILMSSAIEAHRAIEENVNDDITELLLLTGTVRQADNFLKNNLDTVNRKLESWKLRMQLQDPDGFKTIERIIRNAEKNMQAAREKAIHIDYWLRFENSMTSYNRV